MKTLVIHLDDPSTDFLSWIYYDKDWYVIRFDTHTEKELKQIIKNHDRIIMLGHGSPSGLFGTYGYIIDDSFVDILKTKETVCIWCNANQFVKKHNLKGFHSSMFISELCEAEMCGIYNSSEKEIDKSNNLFAELLNKYAFTDNTLNEMKKHYKIDNDPVVYYNNNGLIQN